MAILDPEWYSYHEVACPTCKAKVGGYCIRPSGHSGPFVQPHQERKTVAHKLWREEEMRLYGKQLTSWPDDPQPVGAVPAAPVTTKNTGRQQPAPPPSASGQYSLF